MKRTTIVVSLSVLFLMLLSCTPQSQQPADNGTGVNVDVNVSVEVKTDENLSEDLTERSGQLPEGECQPHWDCISSSTKAYQTEDCKWVERKDCPLGCFNGSCRKGNTCEAGFKCKDENTKGYQTEVCYWKNEIECEWGCSEGKCNPEPENYTANKTIAGVDQEEQEDKKEQEEAPASAQKNIKLLDAGKTHLVGDLELSIYLIEVGRTKLKLGGQKSDWLEEGSSYTFSGGTKIKVESILFQSYPGGTKAVEYTVE